MGKQENVELSVEVVKEIFRALFKERQEQTLLTIVPDSTKLIHERLDELAVDIYINQTLKKNGKEVGELHSTELHFSHSMGAFFPLDSHSMVYLILWGMHGIPHQFPIVRENATKLTVWSGNRYSYFYHSMGDFPPAIRSPSYGIHHHMVNACMGFTINFP